MLIKTSAPSRANVRAIAGNADSKQIKTPPRAVPKGSNGYFVPGVKSPTTPLKAQAPGNQRGNGTYSPNGNRRILSYCATSQPSSFTSTAELYAPPAGAGSSELNRTDARSARANSPTNARNSSSSA